MRLTQHKKGVESKALIEMIILIIGGVILIGFITVTVAKADEKTSENLCRALNALRTGTKVDTLVGTYNIAPKACKTIDKRQDLPSKEYAYHPRGTEEGAKAEIRDLMARCWWMWLEGRDKNVFDKKWYNIKEGCFICYTFNLGKEVKPFTYDEFKVSLLDPYYAIDTSDRCAPGNQGGKCMDSCNTNDDYFSREVSSNACGKQKCCIAVDRQDECKNKGGRCLDEPQGEYAYYYNKWHCKSGGCYVKPYEVASYLDYIEGSNGAGGGQGAVVFWDDDGFAPDKKYAITFLSPGKEATLGTLAGVAGTAALGVLGVASVVGISSGVGTIPTLMLLKIGIASATVTAAATGGAAVLTGNTGEVKDINIIGISTYDTVKGKCVVEAGIGEGE